ncbi:alpha/beta fold hydrolase [Cellulomonas triticagri]|uniref:Alpha/beta hydrolase n=1 Tax=Cellulomonas triticagri TaxID=2483352 RepID=A0A3M2JPY0_9CELL|nr:alpha/beta hydrolase [Cellulomonas triticagri]RMI14426.1 alpha/beta hydrolase [Cellulomonas triticagri]
MDNNQARRTLLLQRPEGRVAYDDAGTGPLVVAVPGMGDLRSTYDELRTALLAAGYRVVTTDLRGHGDSDPGFTTHGDEATAGDVIALVEHLDAGPAVLVGNSMGSSAAAVVAADRPDLVRGLVLLAPFLRDPAAGGVKKGVLDLVLRAMLTPPWGAGAWARYYRTLNAGTRSPRLDAHTAALREALRRPGYLRAFRHLALALDHSVVERRLDRVRVPAVAVVGALDPDWPDPAAEAAWIGETIGARTVLVPDAGHYPQHQTPDVVVAATLDLLAATADPRGAGA